MFCTFFFLFNSYVCNKTYVWCIEVQSLKNCHLLFKSPCPPHPLTKISADPHVQRPLRVPAEDAQRRIFRSGGGFTNGTSIN